MRSKLRTTIVALLILTVPLNSKQVIAQAELNIQIVPSTISDLLRHPTVTAIFRDKSGVLWIGTQYGLYRLNGSKNRFFSSNSAGNNWIPASDIRAIKENSSGELLVGTFGGGVLKFDLHSDKFNRVEVSDTESPLFVTALHYSRSGLLWIGTTTGLSVVSLLDSRVDENFKKRIEQISSPINILSDKKGVVYIATKSSGLWKIDEERLFVEVMKFDSYSLQGANAMALGAGGKLFVGAENGQIFSLEVNSEGAGASNIEEIATVPPPISSMSIKNESLLIGTSHGLHTLNLVTLKPNSFLTTNSRISNNHVTKVYNDGRSVWIGTYQGLDSLRFTSFKTYNSRRGGISEDVLAFEEDSHRNLWVGTYNGLFVFRGGLGVSERAERVPTADAKIMAIAEKKGDIWLGFRQASTEAIDSMTFDTKKIPTLDKDRLAVTTILHDCRGWTWIGTYGDGLYLVQKDEAISLLDNDVLAEEFATIVTEVGDCEILVGTETSIHRYDPDLNSFLKVDTSFQDSNDTHIILSLEEDSKGNIWVGTKDNGVFQWSSNQGYDDQVKLKKLQNHKRLEDISVYGIETDGAGNIWISTQNGLIKLDERGKYVDSFNLADGLQGNDFNFGASYRDSSGLLYFGGINGFSVFEPSMLVSKHYQPNLLITGIVYNNSEEIISIDTPKFDSIVLDRTNHFITFQFSVLDFIDPENNKFRHKLENFDPDWIDIDSRNTATYTNLPPGEYTFRVQGANSAGIWNREGLSIGVTVLPPPWLTWWALLGYAILLLLLFWLWGRTKYSYILMRAKQQLETQMHDNEERAYEELHEQYELNDKLARTAHDHSINTLQTITSFLAAQRDYLTQDSHENLLEKSDRIVSSLATLEDCLYYSSEQQSADLRQFTQQRFSELTELFNVDSEKLITINDVSKRRVPAEAATPLAVFINEALENALQHAFNEEDPVYYLQVSLTANTAEDPLETNYSLTISDSGTGIPGNIDPAKRETLGFAIMYDMAERLSARLKFSSDKGTRVELTFSFSSED